MALHTKQVGVAGEHFFAFRALEEGLDVAFPTGDNSPHDLIVSSASGYFRVQIKTTNVLIKEAKRRNGDRYMFSIRALGICNDGSSNVSTFQGSWKT